MNRCLLIVATLVAIIAAGAFLYLSHESATGIAPQAPTPPRTTSSPDSRPSHEFAAGSTAPAATTREVPDADESAPPLLPALPLQKGELVWEARIRAVLETPGISDADIARRLFEIIPGLQFEGRATATEEAIAHTSNANYRTVAQPVISNPTTYPPSLVLLFTDLMQRPEEVQRSTLLAIARNPENPLAKSAQQNLSFVLKQQLGTDWPRWDAAIRDRLAAHP